MIAWGPRSTYNEVVTWPSLTRSRRAAAFGLAVLVFALGLSSCSAGYVLRSAWYQAELLGSRVPIEKARKSGRLTAEQLAALDRVADIKTFGREIGLQATRNYDSIALDWNRHIWNVSACAPLSFQSKTWWFPIVGRVPYLGYFERAQADGATQKLAREGWDVYLRETGAYSTLGWFRDPILPSMLRWDEFDLADTILHELAHATLWVKGSVAFNESFASFVGEEGAFRYLEARHGRESDVYRRARARQEDYDTWRDLQRGLYRDLENAYADGASSDAAKRERKAALFASLPERVEAAPFHERAAFARAAREGVWNNARLAQFRAYNSNRPSFEKLLARSGGDLVAFIERVRVATREGEPFAALARAAEDPS
jgi:predicted aminopeptidase